MIYAGVAVALLILGGIASRVGRKLGTALALVPVAVWFGFLVRATLTGTVEGAGGDALLAYLLVGLIAFLVGSNLTSRSSSREQRPR